MTTPAPAPLPDWLSYDDPATPTSATVTLSRPFKTDAGEIATVSVREPLVGDEIGLPESAAEHEIGLLCRICALSPEDMRRLPMRDYGRLQRGLRGFLS